MTISASQVKELRERTGAGMMDCKKALSETNGDMEKAIEELRKKGVANAAKKGGRITAEGLSICLSSNDNKKAIILEVNCETDFVAREEKFKSFILTIAEIALNNNLSNTDELAKAKYNVDKTVEEMRMELVSTIGENITLRRMDLFNANSGTLATYTHGGSNLSRIVSLAIIDTDNKELAMDLAMHVAAMKPEYLTEKEVPLDRIAKEKEIYLAQARTENTGKPEEILEKIISGKVNKFVKSISLYGQSFIKEPSKTIEQLLKENSAKAINFSRFEVGEGIEKKQEDFAAEVMSQIQG